MVRDKQMQYEDSNRKAEILDMPSAGGMTFSFGKKGVTSSPVTSSATNALQEVEDKERAYNHELITRDYDKCIQLAPEFVYAYFNRANLRCALRDYRAAIQDYTEAIERDPEFAEAYFNRGLARLSQGDTNRGIADLSKAGELGIVNAYSIIKRMMN